MSPSTMKQWVVEDKEHGFDGLVYKDAVVPKVGENEDLVKLHAASLNYRDLIIPKGQYPFALRLPVVPGSDGAGEVIEVGSKVAEFKNSIVCRVCWEAQLKVRKVNPTPSREPKRSMPCWTSPRRHSGFAVACHEGSLIMGAVIRPREALTRL